MAIKGSRFCHVHSGQSTGFPPVKITAYVCPYCEEPIRKNAESCDGCEESFKICPYCDEPLKRDVQLCSFCKLDRTAVQPVHNGYDHFAPMTPAHPGSTPAGSSLTIGLLFAVPLILVIGFLYFFVIYLFSF